MSESNMSVGSVRAVKRIEQLFQTADESFKLTEHLYKALNINMHVRVYVYVSILGSFTAWCQLWPTCSGP